MDKIFLELKFINHDNKIESLLLKYSQKVLSNSSAYFRKIFNGKFNDQKNPLNGTDKPCDKPCDKVYMIDLTFFHYPISQNHIIFLFEYATSEKNKEDLDDNPPFLDADVKYADDISICASFVTSQGEEQSKSQLPKLTYNINDHFVDQIGLDNFISLIQLNDYFMFDDVSGKINTCLKNFSQQFIIILDDTINKKVNSEYIAIKMQIYENITLLESNAIIKKIHLYKKAIMLSILNQNLPLVFVAFVASENTDLFFKMINILQNIMIPEKTYFNHISMSSKPLLIDIKKSIGFLPLIDNYLLLKKINKYYKIINNSLDIYEYYDMLIYEPHTFNIYNPINRSSVIGKHTIVPYDGFMLRFNGFTGGIFENFDWSNVIVAGGFIYGLLDNICNSIVDSTDIDMFVYGETEKIIRDKIEYINLFFSKYSPFYAVKKSIVDIINISFTYDIQIIACHNKTPDSIISDFDYGYTMVYFDGTKIITNLLGLLSIKHKVAYLENYNNTQQTRIYKSCIKGLEHVHHDTIQFDESKLKNIPLSKSIIIRKIFGSLELPEFMELLRLSYSAISIFTDPHQVNLKSLSFGADCDPDTDTADYGNLGKIIMTKDNWSRFYKKITTTANAFTFISIKIDDKLSYRFITDKCKILSTYIDNNNNNNNIIVQISDKKCQELKNIRSFICNTPNPGNRLILNENNLHIFFNDIENTICIHGLELKDVNGNKLKSGEIINIRCKMHCWATSRINTGTYGIKLVIDKIIKNKC